MTDMKTWDVHFQVTLPAGCEWDHNAAWEDSTRPYSRIDPAVDDPYICVPGDAVITEVANPAPDGFYVNQGSRTMYQRLNGEWTFWSDSYKCWRESSLTDADVDNELERVNVVA